MPDLFVDCDDTLELYICDDSNCDGTHPFGALHRDGHPNTRLIEEIKKWRAANPDSMFVVWSGGGNRYAERFAQAYFPDERIVCLDKFGCNMELPKKDDIVIDDMDIVTDAPVQNPREWSYDETGTSTEVS